MTIYEKMKQLFNGKIQKVAQKFNTIEIKNKIGKMLGDNFSLVPNKSDIINYLTQKDKKWGKLTKSVQAISLALIIGILTPGEGKSQTKPEDILRLKPKGETVLPTDGQVQQAENFVRELNLSYELKVPTGKKPTKKNNPPKKDKQEKPKPIEKNNNLGKIVENSLLAADSTILNEGALVTFLSKIGVSNSFSTRADIYNFFIGEGNYKGTAQQNIDLLQKLKDIYNDNSKSKTTDEVVLGEDFSYKITEFDGSLGIQMIETTQGQDNTDQLELNFLGEDDITKIQLEENNIKPIEKKVEKKVENKTNNHLSVSGSTSGGEVKIGQFTFGISGNVQENTDGVDEYTMRYGRDIGNALSASSMLRETPSGINVEDLEYRLGITDSRRYELEFKLGNEQIYDKQVKIIGMMVKKLIKVSENIQGGIYFEFETDIEAKNYQSILGGVVVQVGKKFRLNLGVHDLRKYEQLNFERSGQTRNFIAHQLSAGFEMTYHIGYLLYELGLTGIYRQSDNKSFGMLAEIMEDTNEYFRWYELHGYFQGAKVYDSKIKTTWKLADWLRLQVALGMEHLEYNKLGTDIYGSKIRTQNNSKTDISYDIALRAQFLENKMMVEIGYKGGVSHNSAHLGVGGYVLPWLRTELKGEYVDRKERGRKDEWKVGLEFSIPLDYIFAPKSQKSEFGKYPNLFSQDKEGYEKLGIGDVRGPDGLKTKQIYGRAHEHEISILKVDKDSGIEVDKDGRKIYIPGSDILIVGTNAIMTNPGGVGNLFLVNQNKKIEITFDGIKELLSKIGGTDLIMGFQESGGTVYVIDLNISQGSIHFRGNSGLSGLPQDFAAEFVSRNVNKRIFTELVSGNLLMGAGYDMHFLRGNFDSGIVNNFYNGKYSSIVMNAVYQNKYSNNTLEKIRNGTITNEEAEKLAINNPPKITINKYYKIIGGQVLEIFYETQDEDGDNVDVKIEQQPKHGTIKHDKINNKFTYTSSKTFQGIEEFKVIVSDGKEDETVTIQIEIERTNTTPIINDIPKQTLTEGDLFSYQVEAQDPEGDKLTYSISSDNNWLSVDSESGLISGFAPNVEADTEFEFQLIVTDAYGLSSSIKFKVKVLNELEESLPPNWNDIPDYEGLINTELVIELSTYIVQTDGDEILQYNISTGSLPNGMSLNKDTGKISGIPTVVGEFEIGVKAKDKDGWSGEKKFKIIIKDVVDTTPDQFTFVDQTGVTRSTMITSGAVTITGINAASAISIVGGEYSKDGGATWTSANGTVVNNQQVIVRGMSSGNYSTSTSVVLTVGGVSDSFDITTEAEPGDNIAPSKTGESFPNLNTKGASFSGSITFDENVATVTAISISGGGSVSVSGGVGTTTISITGTAPNADTAQISITVEDATGNSRVVTSNVYDLFEGATPPQMGDVPNQTYTSGSEIASLNISNYVTQTDGDSILEYILTGTLPTGLSLNSTTGVISGTPTETGVFNLSVKARDKDGESNSDSFSITVNEPVDNIAPSKTGESFPNLDTKGASFSGSITFNENVATVTAISISGGGSVSVSGGVGTTTISITGTAPNADTAQISITVEDATGNSRVVTSNVYDLF